MKFRKLDQFLSFLWKNTELKIFNQLNTYSFINWVNISNFPWVEKANWFCYHLWAQISSRSHTGCLDRVCIYLVLANSRENFLVSHCFITPNGLFQQTVQSCGIDWMTIVCQHRLWQNVVLNIKVNSCWAVHRMHDITECLTPWNLHH